LVLHETVGETLQIAIKVVEFDQSVVKVIGDDYVLGITSDVHNLMVG
jgi:hypothetical protein